MMTYGEINFDVATHLCGVIEDRFWDDFDKFEPSSFKVARVLAELDHDEADEYKTKYLHPCFEIECLRSELRAGDDCEEDLRKALQNLQSLVKQEFRSVTVPEYQILRTA